MQPSANTKVVLVDDHKLFRKGVLELINSFNGFEVVWEAENGRDFIQKISPQNLPDIVLLDTSMPVMDGFETARWMEQRFPEVKILALSMSGDDETILAMLKAGVNGYVLKNIDPADLKIAMQTLRDEGSYYTNRVTKILLDSMNRGKSTTAEPNDREIEFLKLACTELPYKSFAPIMQINPRLVEDTREKLFRKLSVSSRVGLVIYAIKHKIFMID